MPSIIVVANTGQYPFFSPTWEGQYTDNNIGVGDTRVTPRPVADLRVTSVTAPAASYSGESTTVNWTVQNFGADAWSGTRYWVDDVYISTDPAFIRGRGTLLGSFFHANSGLGTDQSYTFLGNVQASARQFQRMLGR